MFFFLGQFLSSTYINISTKWRQNGITVAGGNGQGNQLNQLYQPCGIYVDDDDQCIYIADAANHRIIQWSFGATKGQVVAGGNGKGDRTDQLNEPVHVFIDVKNDSLIISDRGNRRIVRWSRRKNFNGQIIISDIDCSRLTMDNNGDLYVSDCEKHEVRRWKIGETIGTIVAGGNGKGNQLNQLNSPCHIFVDENQSVYVSDRNNHRVMKWMKDAKEGIVVAGGQGQGSRLTHLSLPQGVIVDKMSNVYIADSRNHRIMRWSSGSKEGSIVLGGNGQGKEPNQFNYVEGLSFDRQGNLYVADWGNNKIQKFDIDAN